MSLREYTRKRDFRQTAEPPAKKVRAKDAAARFVIQKHAASHLHYDFRLEMDGTLKSWAVPKGVPFVKGEKRLAMQVEDHPVEYAGFEGIIPEGQYGGGTVMIWDAGKYKMLGGNPLKDWEHGKLHFLLHGDKLEGEWTLVRMGRGDGREWLLLKSGENVRPVGKRRDDESSLSGRTMAQIRRAHDAEWESKPARRSATRVKKAAKKPARKLHFIEPMKATLVEEPPTRGEWLYELKFDGYRALALKSGDSVELWSRNEKDYARRFPEIAEAVGALAAPEVILDGEIVALDTKGRPSFQLLQALETGAKRPPLAFYVFDLLRQDGEDLQELPLRERRERLEALMKDASEPLRFSATIGGDPKRLLAEVGRRGLEGLIGKEADSRYEAGRRGRSWIKLKCVNEQEFVIGGYTPPAGTRQHFGALLVGVYERKKLRFTGKVGTGFDAALLRSIFRELKARHRETCPFSDLPEKTQGRWSQNITPREMRLCHWVDPELVCQIRFTEWTTDGKLRHPVFLGLREDKAAREVSRERST